MKIAIIGTGNVGGTLGTRWAQKGHQVVFATRNPESSKTRDLIGKTGGNARAARAAEAAAASEVVVLATPWDAARESIQSAGDLTGKVLVDCTNPLAPGLSGLTLGHDTSAAEQIASWAPKARVVKAFNTTGSGNMADPNYGNVAATMLLCGDDSEARSVVAGLARDLGFDVIDAGPLRIARYLEPLAMLWIHLAYGAGLGPDIAIKLLRR